MNIQILRKDGRVAYFDIDDENYVNETLLKAAFPDIFGTEYESETDHSWKMWVSYSKKTFLLIIDLFDDKFCFS